MNLFKLRHHVATWLLLLIVAVQSLYFIPARLRYFQNLEGFKHSPLASFYVTIVPVLSAVTYALLCTEPWRFDEHSKWGGIRMNRKGFLQLLLGCVALLSLDRAGFYFFSTNLIPPESSLWDLVYTYSGLLFIGFVAVIIDGLSSSRDASSRKTKAAEAELLEAKTQLVVAQLDSHNVLNVMANVGNLLERDPKLAVLMVEAASFYLRRLLDCTKVPMIALWEERQIIEDYLSVEAMRMNDRLEVQWDWSGEFDEVKLPPVLIQPMVENAVKHGLWPCQAGGIVRISAKAEGDKLALSVRNTGEPLAKDFQIGATGLDTLRKRLAHEYGPAAHFELAMEGRWTVATVTIPVKAQTGSLFSLMKAPRTYA